MLEPVLSVTLQHSEDAVVLKLPPVEPLLLLPTKKQERDSVGEWSDRTRSNGFKLKKHIALD